MSDCEIVTNNIFSENNINKIFQNGHLLYQGYVDDPRNTDNSWMETQGKKSIIKSMNLIMNRPKK